MTERRIKQKFKDVCKKNDWAFWFPPKVKYYETDIFGIGDCIICRQGEGLVLIQLTTASNFSARKKKIVNILLKEKRLVCPIEVWAWKKKDKCFKVKKIL